MPHPWCSTLQQGGLNEVQHSRHDGTLDTGHCSGLVVDQDGAEQVHDQLSVGGEGEGEGEAWLVNRSMKKQRCAHPGKGQHESGMARQIRTCHQISHPSTSCRQEVGASGSTTTCVIPDSLYVP